MCVIAVGDFMKCAFILLAKNWLLFKTEFASSETVHTVSHSWMMVYEYTSFKTLGVLST